MHEVYLRLGFENHANNCKLDYSNYDKSCLLFNFKSLSFFNSLTLEDINLAHLQIILFNLDSFVSFVNEIKIKLNPSFHRIFNFKVHISYLFFRKG